MKIKVPMTGTAVDFDLQHPELTGGDEKDPLRPLDFHKLLPEAIFSWRATDIDFVNGFMTIEVFFDKLTFITSWDESKTPHEPLTWRKESDAELTTRQAETEQALKDIFEKKTAEELYEISKEARVKKPLIV